MQCNFVLKPLTSLPTETTDSSMVSENELILKEDEDTSVYTTTNSFKEYQLMMQTPE